MAKILLDTSQAAERLGVSEALLNKDRVSGKLGIPFVRIGKSVRYDEADLETWICERKVTSTSEVAS